MAYNQRFMAMKHPSDGGNAADKHDVLGNFLDKKMLLSNFFFLVLENEITTSRLPGTCATELLSLAFSFFFF